MTLASNHADPGPDVLRSTSPHDPTDLVVEHGATSPADVAAVAARARTAQSEWWASGAAARAAALHAAADALSAESARAADLIVREVGKPRVEAVGEVARTVAILRYYAQACFAADGATFPPSLGGLLFSRRHPHGVAGLVTPWNFPLAIPMWKAAPAMAAGNAVLLKPSPDAMAGADLLAELVAPRLPAGLFSVLHGGADTGAAVVAASDVVSFTGSSAIGRQVVIDAATHGVPVQAEMGGQNAAIVLPDADPVRVAAIVAGAAMGFAGQKCTATRRIIVVDDGSGRESAMVDAITDAVRAMTPRDPDEAGHVVGPVIDQASRDRVVAAIAAGVAAGGRVLAGGVDADGMPATGWYVHPTLLDGVPADHHLACEETFGPLAIVQRVDSVGDAVALANSVRYGLVSSVHGRDLDRVLDCASQLRTGIVKVNAPTSGVDFYAPFGGDKDSSYGQREQGTAGIDFYSTTTTVAIAAHGG